MHAPSYVGLTRTNRPLDLEFAAGSSVLQSMPDAAPKHKDTRFHGIQRVPGREVEYTDMQGRTVYKGPGSGTEQTIAETYCGHCQKWIQTNGVTGPLMFMAKHEDGDCQKS